MEEREHKEVEGEGGASRVWLVSHGIAEARSDGEKDRSSETKERASSSLQCFLNGLESKAGGSSENLASVESKSERCDCKESQELRGEATKSRVRLR